MVNSTNRQNINGRSTILKHNFSNGDAIILDCWINSPTSSGFDVMYLKHTKLNHSTTFLELNSKSYATDKLANAIVDYSNRINDGVVKYGDGY